MNRINHQIDDMTLEPFLLALTTTNKCWKLFVGGWVATLPQHRHPMCRVRIIRATPIIGHEDAGISARIEYRLANSHWEFISETFVAYHPEVFYTTEEDAIQGYTMNKLRGVPT